MMVVYGFTASPPASRCATWSSQLACCQAPQGRDDQCGHSFCQLCVRRAYLAEEKLNYVIEMGLKYLLFMARYDRIHIEKAIADAGANDRIVRDGEHALGG